jgi:hypothetical protein
MVILNLQSSNWDETSQNCRCESEEGRVAGLVAVGVESRYR